MCESAATEVDVDFVQGQTLSFVDGQRPGEAERQLPECAGDRLDDFVRAVVEGVAAVLPGGRLDLVLAAGDVDEYLLVGQPRDARDRAVNPAAIRIVTDHHHFGAGLEL